MDITSLGNTPQGEYLNGLFDMDFSTESLGENDERSLEVCIYPLLIEVGGGAKTDQHHPLAMVRKPSTELGVTFDELGESRWMVAGLHNPEGLKCADVESAFGPNVGMLVLSALVKAYAAEYTGIDMNGVQYRPAAGVSAEGHDKTAALLKGLAERVLEQQATQPLEETVADDLELAWGELPPPRNPRKRTAESTERILAALKANPGKWALVMTVDYSGGHNQWYGHGVEITRRKNDDGKFDVWMRWPAPESDAMEQAGN